MKFYTLKFVKIASVFLCFFTVLYSLADEKTATTNKAKQIKLEKRQFLYAVAAAKSKQEIRKLMTDYNLTLYTRTKRGGTSLHLSVETGNFIAVKALLQLEPDLIKSVDEKGRLPLHYSARQADTKTVEREKITSLLIETHDQQNLFFQDSFGDTPLIIASGEGNTHFVTTLLSNLEESQWQFLKTANNNKRSALHEAAEEGFNSIMQALLTFADKHSFHLLDAVLDNMGDSPFHYAAQTANAETLLMMHAHLQKLYTTSRYMDSVRYSLHLAAKALNEEAISPLIDLGFNPNEANKWEDTPLHLAAGSHRFRYKKDKQIQNTITPNVIRKLVQAGANIYAVDTEGNTPLHRAAGQDNLQAIEVLAAEFGADVNSKNKKGETPLHLSSSPKVINLLAQAGAKIDARDNKSRTPLLTFFKKMKIERKSTFDSSFTPAAQEDIQNRDYILQTVQTFVHLGADPHAKDRDGNSILHYIASSKISPPPGIIEFLVNDLKIDINNQNLKGSTPLLYAIGSDHYYGQGKKLLELGADPNIPNTYGNTAVHAWTWTLSEYGNKVWDHEINRLKALLRAGGDFYFRNKSGISPEYSALHYYHEKEEHLRAQRDRKIILSAVKEIENELSPKGAIPSTSSKPSFLRRFFCRLKFSS